MFCSKCGTKIPVEESVVCPECGEMLDSPSDVAEPAPSTHPVSSPSPVQTSKPLKSKKPIIAAIAATATIVLLVAITLLIFNLRSHPLTGTWEEAAGTIWRGRMMFNSDGTGLGFDINADTGMTRDEENMVWMTSRDFPDLLRLETIDENSPNTTEIFWLEFEITINAVGDEILNVRPVSGFGGWQHFRRIN